VDLARLKVVIEGESAGAERAISGVRGKLDDLQGKADQAGRSMTKGVTLPLVGVGTAAWKTATDFESSMVAITTLAGVPREQVQAWEDDVRNLARTYGKSGAQAADALFFIVSAGLEGEDAMNALEVALKASAVGLGTVEDLAGFATSAIANYGSDVYDAATATDILAAAASAAVYSPTELGAALKGVLPRAANLGVSLEELGGLMAALGPSVNSASEAQTRLGAVMKAFMAPSRQAQKILERVGLSGQALRDTIEKDGLLAAMRQLETALDGDKEALTRVMGSAEALDGMVGVLGRDAGELAEIFDTTNNALGIVADGMEHTAETGAFQMEVAIAELKDLMVDVGQDVIPVVVEVLGHLKDVLGTVSEWWRGLTDEQRAFIVKAAAVAAAVGPVLLIVAKLLGVLKILIPVIKGVVIVGKLLALAAAGISAPVLALVAAIAAVIAVGVLLWKNWEQVAAVAGRVWDWIKGIFSSAGSFIGDRIYDLIALFGRIPAMIMQAFAGAGTWLLDAGRQIISGLWDGLRAMWDNVAGWFRDVTSWIPKLKGPASVDARLLVENGELIMGGLAEGLAGGFVGVEKMLRAATSDLGGFGAGVGAAAFAGAPAAAAAPVSIQIDASLTVAGTVDRDTLPDLRAEMRRHAEDVARELTARLAVR
jgi:TP901 family phage tail tape measure protein